jgi:hypothetical protein
MVNRLKPLLCNTEISFSNRSVAQLRKKLQHAYERIRFAP